MRPGRRCVLWCHPYGRITFDAGEIGLFRIDSAAARTTQVGPKPVSPAGIHGAAPPAVIPAAAFVASDIKPVIYAGAEPSAGPDYGSAGTAFLGIRVVFAGKTGFLQVYGAARCPIYDLFLVAN